MLIWLASYPKSGNTWVRMLVDHYGQTGRDIDARHSDNQLYWFQAVSPIPFENLNLGLQAQLRGAAIAHLQCFINIPTLVKTHHVNMSVNEIPLFPHQWTDKVIYVVRDPRDIVASFQKHMGLETLDRSIEMMNDINSIIQQDNTAAHILATWSYHIESWTRETKFEPLIVKYEDLHEDTERELTRILEYCGLIPDKERMAKAIELCQFDRLQKKEQEHPFPEVSTKADVFFRKGRVGSYKEELSDEQIARVEEHHGEAMQKMGYALTSQLAIAE